MNVKEFESKYQDRGGIEKLTELRSLFFAQKYIAKHFGVSPERVGQWTLELFGTRYDPRPERKEAIIASMLDFAMHNPKEDFDFAFKGTQYYKEVLEDLETRKIYE